MLTQKMINQDFKAWNKRIETAKRKLSELPDGWMPTYKERKKCKDLGQKYQADIKHIYGLYRIAIDGIKMHGFEIPEGGGALH